jgi:MFS family permease
MRAIVSALVSRARRRGADRWRKKHVLIAGDSVRALALATLPAAWLLDVLTLWQVYAVALVCGLATLFFDVAYQSYLPDLVPSDRIGEETPSCRPATPWRTSQVRRWAASSSGRSGRR